MGVIEEIDDEPMEVEEEECNKCEVCKKPADLKCQACKAVFYCSRECQKKHWKKHKNQCNVLAYKIEKNDVLGRYLVANRDLKADEIVFAESPLVVGPTPMSPPICLACYTPANGSYFCRKSSWPVCGPECEQKVSKNPEVVIPHQTGGTFEIDTWDSPCYLYECISPLRALLMQKSSPKKFQKILQLESHLDKRRGTEAWSKCQETVIDVMKKTLGVMVFEALAPSIDFTDELIQRLVGIFETNAIEIRLPQSEVQALYEIACLLEHNCAPNLKMTFDDKFNVTVRAGRDIKKGENLNIMYTHSLWGTWARRDHLNNVKKFWCACGRCKDPSELGSNLSALMCSGKVLLPANPLDQDCPWTAVDGSDVEPIPSWRVQEEINRIGADLAILQMKGTVDDFEGFLEKNSEFLHQNHFHMLTAKHSLMQMLGRVEEYLIQDMTESQLKRKEDLCREMIELCEKIDPCKVRLSIYMGVAMYELHLPLLQYAKRAWEGGEMPTEEFRVALMEPRNWLTKAMDTLRDETNEKLPEGLMRLQVKDTLDQLESFMKTVGCEF